MLSNRLTEWNNRGALHMDFAQNPRPRLLLCSHQDDSVLAMQSEVFRGSGYEVVAAGSSEAIQEHIENTDFDVIILNHTLSFADRQALAGKAKLRNPSHGVLVLHHSGSLGNPDVDLAVDSRAGVRQVLHTLKRLEAMLHARSHNVSESGSDYVVVADMKRNYTFVTDPVCDLLGYDRAMFLERRIDDVVDGSTHVTEPLFKDFVAQGKQAGKITFRHRSGRKVAVKYTSHVELDGCIIA